jgi:hypothetical protein
LDREPRLHWQASMHCLSACKQNRVCTVLPTSCNSWYALTKWDNASDIRHPSHHILGVLPRFGVLPSTIASPSSLSSSAWCQEQEFVPAGGLTNR